MSNNPRQTISHYQPKIMLALFLAQIACGICLGGCGNRARLRFGSANDPGSESRNQTLRLSAGEAVRPTLKEGECHSYEIPLSANQFARIVIENSWRGLNVTLVDPSGETLYDYAARPYGLLPISVVARTSGKFVLRVRPEQREGPAQYKVGLDQLRQSTPEDQPRVVADEAFAEAEVLRTSWELNLLRRALGKYAESQSCWEGLGEQRNLTHALLKIGELHLLLGQSKKALDYFNDALRIARSGDDRPLEIQSLNHIGSAYVELSDGDNILIYSNMARELSLENGDAEGEAAALNTSGLGHYLFGDLPKATENFVQSLDLSRGVNYHRGRARALTNLGYAHQDLGDFHKALDYYTQSLTLWEAIGDRQGQAFALTACGNAYSFLGERQRALSAHNEALRLFQSFGELQGQASALNGIGFVYDLLGEERKALDSYNQSLQLSRAAGNRDFECLTIGYIGRVYVSLGDRKKAIEYFNQRLRLSRALKDRRIEAHTLRDLGSIFDFLNQKAKALDHFTRALALHKAVMDRQGQIYTLNNIGHVYETLGDEHMALHYYKKALPLAQAIEDRRGEPLTLYNMSRVYNAMGSLAEARGRIEAALDIIESLRTNLISRELRASYLASTHQCYELYIDVLMRMHRANPSLKLNALALKAAESARARSLLDILAEAKIDLRQGAAPDLLDRERDLQQRLNAEADRRMRLLSNDSKPEQAESLKQEIRTLTGELQEVQSRIREKSPRYAALTQPVPLSLAEIQQQVLDGESALLEYSLGDRASYLWLVLRDSIESYELPGRKVIEALSKKFYESLAARQPPTGKTPPETPEQYYKRVADSEAEYVRAGSRLSRILLGQVASRIGGKRLLIIADDVLQYIPFSALPAPDQRMTKSADGRNPVNETIPLVVRNPVNETIPLVVKHEIVSLPSASAVALLRKEANERERANTGIAVFADPVFGKEDVRVNSSTDVQDDSADKADKADKSDASIDLARALRDLEVGGDSIRLPRLFSSRKEAEAILEMAAETDNLVALDFRANLAGVLSPELSHYRIVHFATHSILDDEHPELSGIVFSLVDEQGQDRDGFLRLYDIYNLKLEADMVVLSACNTGLGKNIRGEGLVGLTRGFMYAGVPKVIASFWRVDDLSTAYLMKLFYKGILNDGLSESASLQRAQIEMWNNDRWKAPYYWAGFGLQGEWKPR